MTSQIDTAEGYLLELAREMRSGQGDSERAEYLRSKLEIEERRLGDESALLRELSEDLYFLENARIVQPLEPGETLASMIATFPQLFNAGDTRKTLHQLRKLDVGGPWNADQLLAMFGRCWNRLGFRRAAAEFYDAAFQRGGNAYYAVQALNALWNSGDKATALRRANDAVDDPKVPNAIALRAASLLYGEARSRPVEDQTALYQRVIALVERAGGDVSILGSVRADGFLAAGFAWEHLGNLTKALFLLDRAVDSFTSDATLVARGLTLAKLDRRKESLEDFDEAVRRGTRLAWPYLHLAHDSLIKNEWRDAYNYAIRGLERSEAGPLRARLFEWCAIAAANLQVDEATVSTLFLSAIAEDPSDVNIARNLEIYRQQTKQLSQLVVVGTPEVDASTLVQGLAA